MSIGSHRPSDRSFEVTHMEASLFDRTLDECQANTASVSMVLQNKVRISGRIVAYDSYVVVLENKDKQEIIYRHAVASVAAAPSLAENGRRVPDSPRASRPRSRAKGRASSPSAPKSASPREESINSSMKEGLLKWMEGRKASR